MSVIIALVVLVIFFLLVGKFAKCCYNFYSTGTDTSRPYYVAPNPIHMTNTTSDQLNHYPILSRSIATTTIAVRCLPPPFEYQENHVSHENPPSYYEDPPPPYEQVCGNSTSVNKHQSRQI